MVSGLDSGSNGFGSSTSQGTALCPWARHFTLTVPLFPQVLKWVLTNVMPGVALQWTSISSRGSKNTCSDFMVWKFGPNAT